MKWSAMAALLVFALPAQAQLYKCVDERGKTQYSDKPIPGCKTAKATEAPRPAPVPAAKAKTREAPKALARGEPVAPEQLAGRCKTLREEQEWLNSADGKAVPFHTERVAQVEQALSGCR
jgi:hypothetical protein